MLRGTTTFVCDNCGHKFKGMDMEWGATTLTCPLPCPQCGSMHTCPPGFLGLNKRRYRSVWMEMDGKKGGLQNG